jgi:hypothetical protein
MQTSHGSLRTLAMAALVLFTSMGAARALAPIYPHTMRVSQSAHSFTVRWVNGTSINRGVNAEKKSGGERTFKTTDDTIYIVTSVALLVIDTLYVFWLHRRAEEVYRLEVCSAQPMRKRRFGSS